MTSSFPETRRAGALVLLSGYDGQAAHGLASATVLGQCQHVYGAIVAALADEGLSPSAMVRLDHFTQSQGWLADRQQARAAAFGRPAPLASTGVASLHDGPNLLTVAGIAWGGAPEDKRVVIAGADSGMPAIATAVQAGPWIFISGLLTSEPVDAIAQLERILERLDLDGSAIVRIDSYVSAAEQATQVDDLMSSRLVDLPVARIGAVLPFDAPPRLEITILASRTPVRRHCRDGAALIEANDVLFTGAIDAGSPGPFASEVAECVGRLAAHLDSIGRDIAQVARLEVCLADPGLAGLVEARLRDILTPPLPALVIWAGAGLDPFHLKIAAVIA